mgnify:CR=1 FL=1
MSDKIILGIDPGTNIMGYSIINCNDTKPVLLTIGVLKLSKLDNHYTRIHQIFERTLTLIDEYRVTDLAIESPFYGKNVQSMLKLGRAQGSAMSAALYRHIPIFEYAPLKIKMSITGYGKASKEQVASILQKLVQIKEMPTYLDATDALAVALCHFYNLNKRIPTVKHKKKNNKSAWKEFILKNPDRKL